MFSESQLQDQHLFIRAFENAPIGIAIVSPEGSILKVNQSLCHMSGFSENELTSLTFQASTHHDDFEKSMDLFQKLISGEFDSYQITKRYYHKSGSILWVLLSVSLVRDELGRPSYLISQLVDITEQKEKEEELKKIEELHQLIAEHSQDIIARFTAGGIITYLSPAVSHMLGYEPEEMIGTSVNNFLHPEELEYWHKQEHLDSRKMVYRVRHKKGHYVWQESISKKIRNRAGEIQHVIAICRDITERRKMETILRETEQRHKSLLEYTPVGVCALDKDGRFLDVNPAYEKMTGFTWKELIQMHYQELIFPHQLSDINQRFYSSLNGELTDDEFFLQHKSGKKVEVRVTSSPIIVFGETVGVYAIVSDITEKKQAEEVMRRSEKLSMIGELAAGIAHEIRNPLTSLRGFVQLFQSEDTSESKKLYYEIMVSEIDRINEIVSEMLVLGKPSNETIEIGSITKKLDHIITLFEGESNLRNVVIKREFDENLPFILSQGSLKQVFINLLKNSIESMPNGGEVVIQAKLVEDKVCIRVIDQGRGIPQNLLTKIGEPFFTTKESGTGLGLFVSQRIIQNHRGLMKIESKEGKGTTVEIWLPIYINDS